MTEKFQPLSVLSYEFILNNFQKTVLQNVIKVFKENQDSEEIQKILKVSELIEYLKPLREITPCINLTKDCQETFSNIRKKFESKDCVYQSGGNFTYKKPNGNFSFLFWLCFVNIESNESVLNFNKKSDRKKFEIMKKSPETARCTSLSLRARKIEEEIVTEISNFLVKFEKLKILKLHVLDEDWTRSVLEDVLPKCQNLRRLDVHLKSENTCKSFQKFSESFQRSIVELTLILDFPYSQKIQIILVKCLKKFPKLKYFHLNISYHWSEDWWNSEIDGDIDPIDFISELKISTKEGNPRLLRDIVLNFRNLVKLSYSIKWKERKIRFDYDNYFNGYDMPGFESVKYLDLRNTWLRMSASSVFKIFPNLQELKIDKIVAKGGVPEIKSLTKLTHYSDKIDNPLLFTKMPNLSCIHFPMDPENVFNINYVGNRITSNQKVQTVLPFVPKSCRFFEIDTKQVETEIDPGPRDFLLANADYDLYVEMINAEANSDSDTDSEGSNEGHNLLNALI